MNTRGGGMAEVKAEAPQSTMRRYGADLRSMTQARGSFMQKFLHFGVVPQHEAQKIIEAARPAHSA